MSDFKQLKMSTVTGARCKFSDVFNIPIERTEELVNQSNDLIRILFSQKVSSINPGMIFNALLMLSKSWEENAFLSYLAGTTIGKLEEEQSEKKLSFEDFISKLMKKG